MKKIVLKSESCIGCGACIGIDSEHFEFSDDGFSIIKSQENLESTSLQDAIDACPVAIISLENISDADTKEKEANEVVDEPIETEKNVNVMSVIQVLVIIVIVMMKKAA